MELRLRRLLPLRPRSRLLEHELLRSPPGRVPRRVAPAAASAGAAATGGPVRRGDAPRGAVQSVLGVQAARPHGARRRRRRRGGQRRLAPAKEHPDPQGILPHVAQHVLPPDARGDGAEHFELSAVDAPPAHHHGLFGAAGQDAHGVVGARERPRGHFCQRHFGQLRVARGQILVRLRSGQVSNRAGRLQPRAVVAPQRLLAFQSRPGRRSQRHGFQDRQLVGQRDGRAEDRPGCLLGEGGAPLSGCHGRGASDGTKRRRLRRQPTGNHGATRTIHSQEPLLQNHRASGARRRRCQSRVLFQWKRIPRPRLLVRFFLYALRSVDVACRRFRRSVRHGFLRIAGNSHLRSCGDDGSGQWQFQSWWGHCTKEQGEKTHRFQQRGFSRQRRHRALLVN
mmetsp:Transcript_19281/g.37544  ORF Transcript_19281/g.37544 Transcript_19281/m.37544 type:complete len:395 (-) Transcript_19281:501-1685(-)